jgi:hypothetical protein
VLVLEAELSEEQRVAIQHKFVEPYVKDWQKIKAKSKEGAYIVSPQLEALETMKYTIPLISGIEAEEIDRIVAAYIAGAKAMGLQEISFTPCMPYSLGKLSGWRAIEGEKYGDGSETWDSETYLVPPSVLTKPWDQAFLKEMGDEGKAFRGKLCGQHGSISYARTVDYRDHSPTVEEKAVWSGRTDFMCQRIDFLSSQTDPVPLTFNTFTFKYVEEGETVWTWPLDLTANAAQ